MSSIAPATVRDRRSARLLLVGLAVTVTAVVGILGGPSLSAATSSGGVLGSGVLGTGHHGGIGEADGVVPDGTSVFDAAVPAVGHLDPSLAGALRRAATAAARDGVGLEVNSGWRSPAYQERLLSEAVAKYCSREEAARWVATPDTSPHVSGDAVDLGPSAAAAWLSRHGAHYGLCQIYRNEPWHFELRPDADRQGCPAMYADPTRDPRMER